MPNAKTVLRVDASMRAKGSISRELTDQIITELQNTHGALDIITRDLATEPAPFVDEAWIGANFTAPEERAAAQKETLGFSDTLVEELEAADIIVIGVPVYNFGIPAALKAWIDMIARARRTFKYTQNGPVGLLKGKRAILAVASGGTHVDSEIDFATPYLRHILSFVGITDVSMVAADAVMADASRVDAAKASISDAIAA